MGGITIADLKTVLFYIQQNLLCKLVPINIHRVEVDANGT
jgi:hypothetical protein